MKIERYIGGELMSNGFVIYDKKDGEAYIIDPGYNVKKFIQFIKDNNLRLKGILLTHYHYDHVSDAPLIRQELDCPIYIHREDADYLKFEANEHMEDGDTFTVGDETLQVFHTPGHSFGSVCFIAEKSKMVFTGDTIFNIDLGVTDYPGGSAKTMAESIRKISERFNNEYTIYPGHDEKATMKFVRENNQEFRDIVGI